MELAGHTLGLLVGICQLLLELFGLGKQIFNLTLVQAAVFDLCLILQGQSDRRLRMVIELLFVVRGVFVPFVNRLGRWSVRLGNALFGLWILLLVLSRWKRILLAVKWLASLKTLVDVWLGQ